MECRRKNESFFSVRVAYAGNHSATGVPETMTCLAVDLSNVGSGRPGLWPCYIMKNLGTIFLH